MASTEVRTRSDIENLPIRRFDELAATAGVSRISWASVFAGSVIGLVFQFWLSMLGIAIGAGTIDPLKETNPTAGLGTGGAVWLAVSVVVSSYVGGWIAGRFAGAARRSEAVIHGAASWAVTNIAALLLMGSVVGGLMSGTARVAGSVVTAAGQAAGGQPGLVDRAANAAQGAAQEGRKAFKQAMEQAPQAADRAAKTVAKTGWGIVTLMFLGLCSALFGASRAKPMNSAASRRIKPPA